MRLFFYAFIWLSRLYFFGTCYFIEQNFTTVKLALNKNGKPILFCLLIDNFQKLSSNNNGSQNKHTHLYPTYNEKKLMSYWSERI